MKRSPKVKRDALKAANGCCQQCHWPAELAIQTYMAEDGMSRQKAIAAICEVKGWGNKRALLEAHHVLPLWAGGRDTLENTIAICVGCHLKETSTEAPLRAKTKRVRKRNDRTERILAQKAGRG